MKRSRWRLTVTVSVGLVAALWLATTAAQSSIPNGVFVRESNGATWLILDGQRVNVPVWQATDADIDALPVSDRWAVMNAAGAITAGDRPAWLPVSPSTAAQPPPVMVAVGTATPLTAPSVILPTPVRVDPGVWTEAPDITDDQRAWCGQTAADLRTLDRSVSQIDLDVRCQQMAEVYGNTGVRCFETTYRAEFTKPQGQRSREGAENRMATCIAAASR